MCAWKKCEANLFLSSFFIPEPMLIGHNACARCYKLSHLLFFPQVPVDSPTDEESKTVMMSKQLEPEM